MGESDNDEDGLQSGFFYFVEALHQLASSADKQCEAMPDGLIPWDVRDDALHGLFLRNHPKLAFTPSQKDKMETLVTALEKLPQTTFESQRPLTKTGCMATMLQPAWEPLRKQAAQLIEELAPAIQRNRKCLNLE